MVVKCQNHFQISIWAAVALKHEPRDVPRCGDSGFTAEAATLHRDSEEFAHSLCVVGLGPVVARARVLVHDLLDRGAQAVARDGARCASQVLDRGAQADAFGAARVLDRGAQAVARGGARFASQVLDRGAQAAASFCVLGTCPWNQGRYPRRRLLCVAGT